MTNAERSMKCHHIVNLLRISSAYVRICVSSTFMALRAVTIIARKALVPMMTSVAGLKAGLAII